MKLYMLTTTDNPFNPFTDFDDWYAFDENVGHHTTSFLATIARLSDSLSEAQVDQAIDDAIDEIVRENVNGMYRKVSAS